MGENSCRTLVFGDLIGLNIKGLGLKFLKIKNLSKNLKCLPMNLGYSNTFPYVFNTNFSIFFYKDIRNIYIYSTDYAYLKIQTSGLLNLKKPNKFHKRENGITLVSNII